MKLVKVFALLVVSVLWLGGCSQPIMHWLYQTSVIVDDYRYGDLYRLSNLPQFKDPVTPCPNAAVSSDTARTHLYIIGDSFTEPERLSQQDFPVSYYRRVRWDKQDTIQLDPGANNVLLIESVERHFREHAASKPFGTIDNLVIVSDTNRTNGSKQPTPSIGKQLVDLIHSEGIEERLETVLFSREVFLWFREIKAALTLNAFNRVSPNVSLSQDRKHVFIALDTDSTKRLNAGTSPLPANEVTNLVSTVNKTATHYQTVGFDKVVLSIVPNKATILEPTRQPYNHLIERVQHHPGLNVPVVDVYSIYRKQNQSVYALGDSHWNCMGRHIWIKAVTGQLTNSQR
ncbi:MAG: hypothetical protein EOO39_03160 [Cytophagaceae bacterium]|nr:MAG: hypothetical protein EOO39_03160 [Cytophagaceae bacterium]